MGRRARLTAPQVPLRNRKIAGLRLGRDRRAGLTGRRSKMAPAAEKRGLFSCAVDTGCRQSLKLVRVPWSEAGRSNRFEAEEGLCFAATAGRSEDACGCEDLSVSPRKAGPGRGGGEDDPRLPARPVAAAGSGCATSRVTSFLKDCPASDSGNVMLNTRVEGVDASCFFVRCLTPLYQERGLFSRVR